MTVFVDAIRRWSTDQFAAAVDGFADRYKQDFAWWLLAHKEARPTEFGSVLRKWQATRGRVMRRSRIERAHPPPYLDDLLADASFDALGSLTTTEIRSRSAAQDFALRKLWSTFGRLTIDGAEPPKAVGITKAVILATDGRIGPALDTNVRESIRIVE